MATYATAANLRAYVPTPLPETDAALEALLVRCEREIDLYLPQVASDSGRKIILADQTNLTVDSLRNATCAQAEYHLHMGEAFFVEAHVVPEGPDTNMRRVAPKIAPKATQELIAAGLLQRTGIMTQVGGVSTLAYTPGAPRRTV